MTSQVPKKVQNQPSKKGICGDSLVSPRVSFVNESTADQRSSDMVEDKRVWCPKGAMRAQAGVLRRSLTRQYYDSSYKYNDRTLFRLRLFGISSIEKTRSISKAVTELESMSNVRSKCPQEIVQCPVSQVSQAVL